MKDREAIRRLAGLVERLGLVSEVALIEQDARELRLALEDEPAAPTDDYGPEPDTWGTLEPAAPTDELNTARTDWPIVPTVTREQAEQIIRYVHNSTLPFYRQEVSRSYGWPAFFRAVADALEGK